MKCMQTRVSLTPPLGMRSLPGLRADSLFWRLWKEELDEARVFLLDLSEGRLAPLPPVFVDANKDNTEAVRLASVYENLHSSLEEAEGNGDDEKDLAFKELPSYCSASDFSKNCLATAKPSLIASLLATALDTSVWQVRNF